MAKHSFMIAAALLLAASFTPLRAAEWPSKPVRLVVPLAAGGAADSMGRIFASSLSASFGQQFLVENRTGAGGVVGAEAVARSEPDGYTLIVSGMPILIIAPAMNKNVRYDPIRDFSHIAYFGGTPIVLVVHPSLRVKDVAQFLTLIKQAKEGFEYVSPGFGSVGNMVCEFFAANADTKRRHVSYRGGAVAILDLIAGHAKIGCLTWSTALEHVRAGALVPLAITTAERLSDFPTLPTFAELGIRDLVLSSWFSLSGPANLPKNVVDALNREVEQGANRPEVRKFFDQEAVQARHMTANEFTGFVQSEVEKWTPVVKTLIQP